MIHWFVSLHVFVNCNRQTSKFSPSKQSSKQYGSTTSLHVTSFTWIILIALERFGTTGSAPGKGGKVMAPILKRGKWLMRSLPVSDSMPCQLCYTKPRTVARAACSV